LERRYPIIGPRRISIFTANLKDDKKAFMKLATPPAISEDGSRKYLIELPDGRFVESVFLLEREFFGVCLSTQVGCNMGCVFCATARQRSERNLSSEEIVGQADLLYEDRNVDLPFDYVTLAGMGEPLANYSSSVRALDRLCEKYSSISSVSISTIGLLPNLKKLLTEKKGFRIYLSLHATTDEQRARLIPMAAHYQISDLISVLGEYGHLNGAGRARVSYLLLKNHNDSDSDLERLIALLRGRPIIVQILLWNEVEGTAFERVGIAEAERWMRALRENGIDAYVMPSFGQSVRGGCGQLITKAQTTPQSGKSLLRAANRR
jgi:23S rRNA (adenine2503-C2)-methyltransferase